MSHHIFQSVVPAGLASLRNLLPLPVLRGSTRIFIYLSRSLLCKGRVSDYHSLTSDHLHPRVIVFVLVSYVIDHWLQTALVEELFQEFYARNPGFTPYYFRVQVPLDLPSPIACVFNLYPGDAPGL